MRPTEVLDAKLELLWRLENPVMRNALINHMALDDASEQPLENRRSSAAAIVKAGWGQLADAPVYEVTAELCQLVEAAAAGLDETDKLDRRVQPTRSGLVHFDRGLPIIDVRGKKMLIHWLYWFPVLAIMPRHDTGEPLDATMLMMWNDRFQEPDQIAVEMQGMVDGTIPVHRPPSWKLERGGGELVGDWNDQQHLAGIRLALEVTGRWSFIGCEAVWDGFRLGPATVPPYGPMLAALIADGEQPREFTNNVRYSHALWLLLGQTITATEPGEVSRASRKRADRRKVPSRVTVIRLRRLAGRPSDEEPSLVQWDHRWLVRGFWRWQPVSERHPLAQETLPGKFVARIWIAPYVKGPEDKPLVITEKVYRLDR